MPPLPDFFIKVVIISFVLFLDVGWFVFPIVILSLLFNVVYMVSFFTIIIKSFVLETLSLL